MNITLTSVKALDSGNEVCLSLEISDGTHVEKRDLIILTDQYYSLGIGKGGISEEAFEELERSAAVCSAYKKGLFMLGYGSCSASRLKYKLRGKGFDAESAEQAAMLLGRNGYIDEERDAVREAEKCSEKLWGRQRIISRLYSLGYSHRAISAANEMLDGIDFTQKCVCLIENNYPELTQADTREAVEKAFSALMRMGYTSSEIREAVRYCKH